MSLTQDSAAAKVGRVTLAVFKYTGLAMLWVVQYTVYIPFVAFPVKVAGFAVKAGFVGILLLCLPLIGWAILLLWLLLRHPAPKDPNKRSVWKPWGIK